MHDEYWMVPTHCLVHGHDTLLRGKCSVCQDAPDLFMPQLTNDALVWRTIPPITSRPVDAAKLIRLAVERLEMQT